MVSATSAPAPNVRKLGLTEYESTWRAMQAYTNARDASTPDEIWLTEHPPVYTQGIAGKPEHLLRSDTGIPVIKIDRGGQITYHGPGQLVVYLLLDLKRRNLSVRALVRTMEAAVIDLLRDYGIAANYRVDAPGVYVDEAKIAALGLRIRRGCCYHGLALNIDMDLSPFSAINPCGYEGLAVSQLRDLGVIENVTTTGEKLTRHLLRVLSKSNHE
jgi:lipoyl(octanoyl) transferase